MAVIQYHGHSPDSKTSKQTKNQLSKDQGELVETGSESPAEDWLLQGKEYAEDCVQRLQSAIQEKPRVALLAALGAGFVLRRMPLGKIIGAQLKLTAGLIPPAIFAYGAAKVYETLKKSSKS